MYEHAARCGVQLLGAMTMKATDPNPLALRLQEAAKLLNISPRCLWTLAKQGRIPCVRVGNGRQRQLLLFPVDALRRWLEQQAQQGQDAQQAGGGQ
jgi:excisionase family DNA binding protein